jgi:hypothetical protein
MNERATPKPQASVATIDPALQPLERLLGDWATEATHPAVSGVVRGSVHAEWLEGARFLIHRAVSEHPDFPDSTSIIGFTERDRVDDEHSALPAGTPLGMHYFDSRGVFRLYRVNFHKDTWSIWRDSPGFSQRFTGTITDDGNTIIGKWQLQRDDLRWEDDLQITYRRK